MVDHLEEAKKLKNEFKVREAAVEFEKAFEQDPKNAEAAANAGLCNMMMGNLGKSKDFFMKAAEINPGDELIKLYIAMVDVAMGEKYSPVSLKDATISVSEQFMAAAEMFYQILQKQAAFSLFEAVVADIKDDAWLNLASNQYRVVAMLARYGFFIEAKGIADNLLAENDKSWHGYASLGQIELEQGNIDAAKSWFKKAIQHGGDQEPLVVAAIADVRFLEVSKNATKH